MWNYCHSLSIGEAWESQPSFRYWFTGADRRKMAQSAWHYFIIRRKRARGKQTERFFCAIDESMPMIAFLPWAASHEEPEKIIVIDTRRAFNFKSSKLPQRPAIEAKWCLSFDMTHYYRSIMLYFIGVLMLAPGIVSQRKWQARRVVKMSVINARWAARHESCSHHRFIGGDAPSSRAEVWESVFWSHTSAVRADDYKSNEGKVILRRNNARLTPTREDLICRRSLYENINGALRSRIDERWYCSSIWTEADYCQW